MKLVTDDGKEYKVDKISVLELKPDDILVMELPSEPDIPKDIDSAEYLIHSYFGIKNKIMFITKGTKISTIREVK